MKDKKKFTTYCGLNEGPKIRENVNPNILDIRMNSHHFDKLDNYYLIF